MNVQTIQHGNFFFAIVDDFYDDKELKAVVDEVESLKPKLKEYIDISSAIDSSNCVLRTGHGVWVDDIFGADRSKSSILTINRKLFNNELTAKLYTANIFYKHIKHCTKDWTILNIYESTKEYKNHVDESMFTAVYFLKFGEVVGGDLVFPEANAKVEFKHNRLVIFPGCMEHLSEKVLSCNGGYKVSIAQFLNYK